MLFSVEQALVGRDEKRAPWKTPAWEAIKQWDMRHIIAIKMNKKKLNKGTVSLFVPFLKLKSLPWNHYYILEAFETW